ncbi:MAG: hypothetical protein ABI623_05135 [bacterium]
MATRAENEFTFGYWTDHPDGTRTYWYEVKGKVKGVARYVKLVDAGEQTLSFRQEIYDDTGRLVEIHDKYPVDKGHTRLKG